MTNTNKIFSDGWNMKKISENKLEVKVKKRLKIRGTYISDVQALSIPSENLIRSFKKSEHMNVLSIWCNIMSGTRIWIPLLIGCDVKRGDHGLRSRGANI